MLVKDFWRGSCTTFYGRKHRDLNIRQIAVKNKSFIRRSSGRRDFCASLASFVTKRQ
jgi:hypothetical protein